MKNCFGIISLAIIAVLFSSCKKLTEDEELSMQHTDYTGAELRTDGYYYRRYQYIDREGVQQDDFIPLFLYRNGISTYGYVYPYSELEHVECDFKNGNYSKLMVDDKFRWRIFQVHGNTIEFEGWDGNGFKWTTFKEYGEIIDDTTFMITKEINNGKVHEYAKGDVFRFKQFSPKPDSTNRFIK